MPHKKIKRKNLHLTIPLLSEPRDSTEEAGLIFPNFLK